MDNKKFYWIKLKTDFFNREDIDFLLSQNNGCEYVVLYQMLCLMTANNNGNLATNVGEIIVPYDVEKIARDTKYFSEDTIRVALELYKQLGLIYEEQNKLLKISEIERMVGSESASRSAIKKREQRMKKKIEGTTKGTNCLIENRDKRLENRDKRLDIEKELYNYIETEFGRLLSPTEIEKVQSWLSSYEINIIKLAIQKAILNGKRNFSYINGILNNWKNKTYDEIIDEDKKNVNPNWMDKEIKKEDASDEELEELEKLLEDFK